MPSLRDLLERRVPQYVAIYLGAGWGLVEFFSFLEQRYAVVQPIWTDLTLATWALLIPSVVLYTYHHGRPGKDSWARAEKVAIPINVIVAAVVLGTAFSGRDLSATVTKVTVTDENGEVVERQVARSEHRKRLALFGFETPAEDTATAWLRTALPNILGLDLSQDIFLDMRLPVHFREQLREAGYSGTDAVPLALKRSIAQQLHLPYFLTGRVETGPAGALTLHTQLYETATGRLLNERSAAGPELLPLVDQLTELLKQDLGLPAARAGGVQDLPIVELLSHSKPAVRALLNGHDAVARDDWPTAEEEYARATELDPRFGLAHFTLYQARSMRGNAQLGLVSLAEAMKNLPRIPERLQFLVKIEHFIGVERDMDKAFAVATMMTELYPDDLQGHVIRAQLETYRADRRGAITSLRRVLELDPQQQERLLEIGELQEQSGLRADARATYEDYVARFPTDVSAQVRVARVQQLLGEFDEARATLDRASALEPTSVEIRTELAALHRNVGEFDQALELLREAERDARTAEDRVRALTGLLSYHNFRGEMRSAIQAGERRLAALAEVQPPLVVVSQRMNLLGRYVEAGEEARARELLEQVRLEMQGAIADFWRMGQMEIGMAARDTTDLVQGIVEVRAIMENFGLRFLEPHLAHAEGVLQEERGAWQHALQAYTRQKELDGNAIAVNRAIARVYRQLNRPAEGLRAVDEHLKSMPMSPESNIEAARIHLLTGNTAAARQHVQRARRVLASADATYRPLLDLQQVEQQLAGRP